MTIVFGGFFMVPMTFFQMFCARNFFFIVTKTSKAPYRSLVRSGDIRLPGNVWKMKQTGFSLTTFDETDLEVWCLHSFCSKLISEPTLIFFTFRNSVAMGDNFNLGK